MAILAGVVGIAGQQPAKARIPSPKNNIGRNQKVAKYVLVHGGGHGGWCWRFVAERLRAAGHDVYTPTLTGLGERRHLLTPDTDLETHIADVVNLFTYEDLNDVILVGHSYGGMVISGVADRCLDRVGQLVFLDAAIPNDGEALVDWSPALKQLAQVQLKSVDGVELILWPTPEIIRIYGVTDPDLLAWMQPKLMPHPWKSFIQPLRMADQAAVRRIPRTNINCPSTLAQRPEASLARSLTADRVWEIESGHDVMIIEPEALTNLLLKLAV